MNWSRILWDPLPGGNVEHIEGHDLTTDDVEFVLQTSDSAGTRRSSDRPCVFGYTADGRYIIVVYEVDDDVLIPVTAYEVDEP